MGSATRPRGGGGPAITKNPSEQSGRLVGPVQFEVSLLLNGPLGQGFRLEPLVRNRHPALDRPAVPALGDALLGAPYGGELLAEVGLEGDGHRLRFESAAGVCAISGLLALEGPFGADLAAQLGERRFNTRSLPGNEFTGPWLVHDHLLVGSTRLLARSRRNSPPIQGKRSRHLSNGEIGVPATRL